MPEHKAASTPPKPLTPPPKKLDRKVFSDLHIDAAMHADKIADGYGRRKNDSAMRLQAQSIEQPWGLL